GAETGLHALELPEAPDEEPGTDQEHDRESDLGEDQEGARQPAAAIPGLALAAVAERGLEVRARRVEGGQQPEEQAGREREAEGEGEHRSVDADLLGARDPGAEEADQERRAAPGEEGAEKTADERQEGAFGQ